MNRNRRREAKLAVAGFSIANLCYIRIWSNLLTRQGPQSFLSGTRAIDLASFLIGLCLTGIVMCGFLLAATSRRRSTAVAGTTCVLLIALIPANELRRLVAAPHFVTILALPVDRFVHNAAGIAVLIIVAALIGSAVVRWHAHVATVVVELALVISPLLLYSVGRTLWLLARGDVDRSFEYVSTATAPSAVPRFDGRRVVLIVFDEMDFNLSFAERPPGLELPNFDALRRQGLFADSALPPANATLFSMPSYLTGRQVRRAKPLGAGELELTFTDAPQPVPWSKTPGVLNAVRAAGGRTSLVGFSIPYCRIIKAALSRCAYWPLFGASGETSVPNVVLSQMKQIPPLGLHVRWRELYELVASRSEREVADPGMDLVFLHVPTPHPPGIYDMQTHRFVVFESDYTRGYIGNLALADIFLGRMERAIDQAGLSGTTTLIITSDHHWRESDRFGGKNDLRVPFIVKLSGVAAPVAYHAKIQTLGVGALATAILNGQVKDTNALVTWLQHYIPAQ